MKRTFYPSSRSDREVFWVVALGIVPISFWAVWFGEYVVAAIVVITGITLFSSIYVFQDQPAGESIDEYSDVIAQIKGIETQLSKLNIFLERERQRVVDTESILGKLQQESATLEPIVLTQRQTIEAILSAHASRTALSAWKERILAFAFGVLASLAASYVYAWFTL